MAPSKSLAFPPISYRIKPAKTLATLVLNLFKFDAITTPWRTIYIRPVYLTDEPLIRHELAHIAQIDRDGPWKFWPLCIWYFVRYGHRDSPIEIEARQYEYPT